MKTYKEHQIIHIPRKSSHLNEFDHLYVISDEEIKEGDWFYYKHFGEDIIDKTNENTDLVNLNNPDKYFKKIIASTDKSLELPQIPQQFIEQYIESYNKNNNIDKVMVEYENGYIDNRPVSKGILKVNPDNTINIKLKQKDIYSKEEVIKILHDFATSDELNHIIDGYYYGVQEDVTKNWIKKNL